MPEANTQPDKTQSVTCLTKRGTSLRGNPLKLLTDRIHFVVLDPFTDIQVSEAIKDLRVIIEGQVAYEGGGTIANLSPMSGGFVCEVMLSSPWNEGAFASGPTLRAGFGQFLSGWDGMRRLDKGYMSAVIDLHTFLADLQAWLEPAELRIRLAPEDQQEALRREAVQTLAPEVVNMINGLYEKFEIAAKSVPVDREWEHKSFAHRLVHPYILQSPFVHRTFFKPLGYPGDYEMVDMMFRDPSEGDTLLGRLVNIYALQLPPILSHQSRIQYLVDLLKSEALRVQSLGRPLRVFSMGAGPAREVQRFVGEFSRSNDAVFTLMDADPRTIEYLRTVFAEHGVGGTRKPLVQVLSKSILKFLKGIKKTAHGEAAEQYDVVCCAGLFDYLPDPLCTTAIEAFYQVLAPGGVVVVTNVDDNPSRHEMEIFLEWFVISRNSKQMEQLVPGSIPSAQVSLIADEATGANLFMEMRKHPA